MTIDDLLKEQAERHFAMQRLTNDSVLHAYWNFVEEHMKNGFLPFVIRGAVAWQSESGARFDSPDGRLWLESRYDDLDIKKAASGTHEIWGGRRIKLEISNIEDSKTKLEEAIDDITFISNSISLITGASLNWLPARRLEVLVQEGIHAGPETIKNQDQRRKVQMNIALSRHPEEQTSVVINDTNILSEAFALSIHLERIPNKEAQNTIKTAMSWHAQAGIIPSGLNRFLNYWSSAELVCHSFYKLLPSETVGILSKSAREAKLAELMAAPIAASQRASAVIDWAELVRPTARTKIASIFRLLFPEDGGEVMRKALFDKEQDTGSSMFSIRNDIAHGNYSEYDRDFVSLVDKKLPIIRELSGRVIVAGINMSKTLFQQP
ncbi:hypothetical protein HMI49_03365 [Corallococcus exercitus]|uniref:Apea-like HEPN domain-containing protein n=1 Tax=Corallococcus exercitus TaxID=2316736 RepID=A0A7Y4NPD7_9BACT|nr:hypothetical protein [Corallococcus exercitus]NOK32244.1 hypothetical protein [Corallococcus exercitus]